MLLVSFDFLMLPYLANKVVTMVWLQELFGLILGVKHNSFFIACN
jgi:hypothetical protein